MTYALTRFALIGAFCLFAAGAQAQDAIANSGPISMEAGAYDGTNQVQADSDLCLQANAVRARVCPTTKVDCATTLKTADAKVLSQISRCTVLEPEGEGPVSLSNVQPALIGFIPCCVAMNGQQ